MIKYLLLLGTMALMTFGCNNTQPKSESSNPSTGESTTTVDDNKNTSIEKNDSDSILTLGSDSLN